MDVTAQPEETGNALKSTSLAGNTNIEQSCVSDRAVVTLFQIQGCEEIESKREQERGER